MIALVRLSTSKRGCSPFCTLVIYSHPRDKDKNTLELIISRIADMNQFSQKKAQAMGKDVPNHGGWLEYRQLIGVDTSHS
jgi:hypothetical protein